ncbi:MAG TPA: response regulator transcription factor [Bacteroidales bacterium]|jgi:DNA-binding response OmpR family regulator|nr:response regulator transcription factor [Bacteroidales bacterium]MDI9534156.1 response regulator transcription factor [Bacteroidota bacterium]HNY58660.1 response regulator transcription factor [Bacteroidales bacterium]HOC05358.1 response regulator transcription factor [Bacteroidales bacterium]HOH15940.1 response regulator transcription factor [Bacteroidales bacterium]
MNVLIVEDEKSLANEIALFLKRENFLCEMAHTGREASEKIAVNLYDFVLLDLGLPDYNGLDLIREAKKINSDVSFIIITARGAVEDRVKGLDLGADDYLPKPFALAELHARIMAVARRKFRISSPDITLGDFVMKTDSRKLMSGQKEVELTRKEFDLLYYLVINRNKVLTRHQLYEHIWGNTLDDQYDSNFIDVHIKNIRKKLNAHAPAPWLETARGVGYRISTDNQ